MSDKPKSHAWHNITTEELPIFTSDPATFLVATAIINRVRDSVSELREWLADSQPDLNIVLEVVLARLQHSGQIEIIGDKINVIGKSLHLDMRNVKVVSALLKVANIIMTRIHANLTSDPRSHPQDVLQWVAVPDHPVIAKRLDDLKKHCWNEMYKVRCEAADDPELRGNRVRFVMFFNGPLNPSDFIDLASDQIKQIYHDAASPIGALKLIVDVLKNIEPSTYSLLRNAVSRTEEILGRLKDHGKNEVTPIRTVGIRECIESVVQEKQWIWGSKCDLSNDTSALNNASVVCESGELKRILSNLLNNSFEATSAHVPMRIRISCEISQDNIWLEIEDSGKGMSPETLQRLGRMKISEGKQHLPEAGLGIGVLNAYRMVAAWGGDLNFASKLNVGTTVKLRLRRVL